MLCFAAQRSKEKTAQSPVGSLESDVERKYVTCSVPLCCAWLPAAEIIYVGSFNITTSADLIEF